MVHRQLRSRAWKNRALIGYTLLLWVLRRRKLYRVRGESMLPLLKPGDMVFVNFHAYRRSSPQAGQVVVLLHPFEKDLRIIKRIAGITASGQFIVRGDNPAASTDSRTFGPVPGNTILGRVFINE